MIDRIKNKTKALRQMLTLRESNGYDLDAEEANKIVEEIEGEDDR